MIRKVVNAALLAGGLWLAVWAARNYSADPQRSAAAGAAVLFGVFLNVVGIVCREIDFRPWLRALAIGVVLVALAAVAGRSLHLARRVVPAVPKEDVRLRATFTTAAENLRWVAGALAYLAVSVVAAPRSRRADSEESG